MEMKKILLDTNSCSVLFRGKDNRLMDTVEDAGKVFVSTIVIGELLTGFRAASREEENRKILERFLDSYTTEIADVTQESAEIYSQIKVFLRRKGIPIPTNDVWIASHAIESGAVLISYDKHFLKIPGLRIWDKLKIN